MFSFFEKVEQGFLVFTCLNLNNVNLDPFDDHLLLCTVTTKIEGDHAIMGPPPSHKANKSKIKPYIFKQLVLGRKGMCPLGRTN